MKTKLSLLTLFACAAGTTLFADYENYDGCVATGGSFRGDSLVDSSWRGANLTNLDFTDSVLTGAIFTGATLTNANFMGSVLTGARFTGATLVYAHFYGARLTNADFTDSVITGSNFYHSGLTLSQLYSTKSYKDKNLSGVGLSSFDLSRHVFSRFDLTDADLSSATLTDATLVGADLSSATLTDADFADSVITEADFGSSGLTLSQLYSTKSYKDKNLFGVGLSYLDLSGGDFSGFYLNYTSFYNTRLTDADFTDSVITGANFESSGLTLSQLYSSKNYKDKDLSDVGLSYLDLSGGVFSGVDLTNADLSSATLTDATLVGADLRSATLTNADFTDSVITGANFESSGLTLSQLYSTKSYKDKNLFGVGLPYLDLSGGDFSGVDLTNADLSSATLTDADFTGATFTDVSISDVSAQNANFTDANLSGADFHYSSSSVSNLSGAKFVRANLKGVNLCGATLTNADFTDSVITGANFESSSLTLSQLYSTKSYKDKNLSGVGLSYLGLSGGDFFGFNLRNMDLSSATLTDATLTDADLSFTTLADANLTGATLTNADLPFTTLTNASFTGATLVNANLDTAKLTGADFTNSVITGANFYHSGLTLSQLYSTKNYKDKDLSGVRLSDLDLNLSGGDFSGFNLTNTSFYNTRLTDANFTDSVITGADFGSSRLTLSQLYSTKNYKDKDLSDVGLSSLNLSGGAFSGFNLTNTSFYNTWLTDANFTDANLSGADFHYSSSSVSKLSGAKFVRANLKGADLCGATLTDADFTDSVITGADFGSSGLTLSQLYSSKNYKDKDLSDVGLSYLDLSGGAFSGFDLTNTSLTYSTLTNADFTGANLANAQLWGASTNANFSGADLRGALYLEIHLDDAEIKNTILRYGDISGFSMVSSTDSFVVRKYTPKVEGGESISAKIQEDATISGGAVLSVAEGGALDISTITLAFGIDNEDETISSISVAESGSVTLASGAKIVIDYEGTFDENTRFAVMNWTDSSSIVGLNSLTKGGTLSLLVDGVAYDTSLWDFSTENNALTIFGVATSVDPDPDLPDPDEPIIPDPDVPVIPEEPDRVVISSASQSVDLTETDSSADFDGSLTVFSGTVSGAGSLNSAGTLTFSGDASTHTGTTNITSGTFTVSGSAKLGTGDFDISGTLAISGSRTFSNATRGTGTLRIASGTTTFTNDVGVKTFAVSQGASATLNAGVGLTRADAEVQIAGMLVLNGDRDFSATLSGAGKLTTSGDVNFASDASAHTGTTEITSGTFTVSESAVIGTGDFAVVGTLALNGNRTFENATRGDGSIEISSGATTFATNVGTKTLLVVSGATAVLNVGTDLTRADAEAQVAGTLNLLGTRTFSAKTSGNGKISLASGSDVSFAKAVGVKTLAVENGATLRGSVSMTHGADAKISLAGTLVLNPDKGEKVSLGGGRVEIASSAKLDLVGSNSPFVRATSAQIEALENGERVTIFEGGAVSGNVLAFLRTDADLAAYAQNYAVIYDESNGGLSVRVVKNASALMDGTDTSELSASFVDWALSDANDALNSLSTGFVSAAAWNNLSGGNDPLLNAILAKDAGTARAILDRLSPKSYAAMIAMPVEAFNADARSISARLEQRRYDRFSKRAQWEFFAQLQTNSVENDTATDAPTFDFDTTGLLAGADYKLDQNTVLGVALGASTGEAKVHNGGGKIESTDFRITGFAGKTIENYFVNAGAQLGYASYDIKRNTDYGNASGDTTGWSAGLFADAGTVVTLSEAKNIYATPYIGLAYMHTQADAFAESGSDKAFDADAISGDSLRARLGCGLSWGFSASGAVWRLGLDIAFSHDFLGDEVDVDVTTQDGSSITETAKALPEDMFSIGPSFNVDVSSSASVYGGYSFNAGTDSSVNHSANVGFRMRF